MVEKENKAVIRRLIYRILSLFWFIPFGFYRDPLRKSGVTPHPLVPRNLRDLTLNKMMFPDNVYRAVVADKIAARGWVEERIGPNYLIPLYDICDSADQLRIHDYPLPCVIKSNHASGHVHFVNHIEDYEGIKERTQRWLSTGFKLKREWCYRDIKPRLLVEKMLLDAEGNISPDIKIFCFFGEPVMMMLTTDRIGDRRTYLLSPDWKVLGVWPKTQSKDPPPRKPIELEQMLSVVRQLSAEFDLIRVDLYICDEKIYFSELTNFDTSGNFIFKPHKFDALLLDRYNQLRKEKIADQRSHYASKVRASVIENRG